MSLLLHPLKRLNISSSYSPFFSHFISPSTNTQCIQKRYLFGFNSKKDTKKEKPLPTSHFDHSPDWVSKALDTGDPVDLPQLPNKLGFGSSIRLELDVKCVYVYEYCRNQAENMMIAYQMPDTYFYWFQCTVLHLWMVFVKLRSHSQDNYISQKIFDVFWDEAKARAKAFTGRDDTVSYGKINSYAYGYHGSLIAYDEAVAANDDVMLAEALWRNIFGMRESDVPRFSMVMLADMVSYVRWQLSLVVNDKDFLVSKVPVKFGGFKYKG